MVMPKIDWDELRKGYNDKYNTHFQNNEDFINAIYAKAGVRTLEKILGVNHQTIMNKVREIGCPIRPNGWPKISK